MTRHGRGFTLIEVLIVVAIAGLVLAILSNGFRLGLHGIDSFGRSIRAQADMVPVERALRRLIERMDPGQYPEVPLATGSAHSFVFTTQLPDPAGGGSVTADVRLEVDAGSLVLWWTPHTRGIPFAGLPPPKRQILVDRVERVDIAYAPRGSVATWQSAWKADALPAAVRVKIVPTGGGEDWPPIIARPPREQAEE